MLVQVVYDIPDDIYMGLLSGQLTRFGSVVRDHARIVAHVPEVTVRRVAEKANVARVPAALKDPRVLIGMGVVAAVAAGGGALWAATRKKRAPEPEVPECVEVYNAALGAYLEAVRKGAMRAEIINRLISALDTLKEEINGGRIDIEFSTDQSQTLVDLVAGYTRKLDDANSVDRSATPDQALERADGVVVNLRAYLERQRRILSDADEGPAPATRPIEDKPSAA